MTETRVTWAVVLVAGAALVGCKETTSSVNIRTPGIAISMIVTAESADQSRVDADLQVGGTGAGATYVDLEGGDQLLASIDDGEESAMQVESAGVYYASFPTGAADTAFRVNFDRSQDDDAPNSSGTLPAPFELGAPVATDSFSRAEDVEVTWDPGGGNDAMRIEWNGDCIFLGSADIPGDTGSYTIAADTLERTGPDSDPEPTCDVDLTVRRMRNGSPDPILDPDSFVRLEQVRTTTFTSAP